MRINVDRLCELAGVPGARRTRGYNLINEGRGGSGGGDGGGDLDEKEGCSESEMPDELEAALNEEESDDEDSKEKKEMMSHGEDLDEMIEINEADLVKELRRARVLMREKRRVETRKRQKLQEMQLKGIIDQEVKNVLKELQLTSGWIYGKKKPTRSRPGYTHQGAYLKGLGFK